ncbi:Hypothetical Protein RSKD131_3953 [Cereibacter sphaeroides KD131]|nr:Hypothetical Protein RSKD131_3953 [Cereibacter sphaeroides KD131]
MLAAHRHTGPAQAVRQDRIETFLPRFRGRPARDRPTRGLRTKPQGAAKFPDVQPGGLRHAQFPAAARSSGTSALHKHNHAAVANRAGKALPIHGGRGGQFPAARPKVASNN